MGAIIAILIVYAGKLFSVFAAAPHDPTARRFILSVLIAFLPAVVVGVLAHDVIKTVLFETPMLIAVMLILGGIVLLFVDGMAINPKYNDAMHFPIPMALGDWRHSMPCNDPGCVSQRGDDCRGIADGCR